MLSPSHCWRNGHFPQDPTREVRRFVAVAEVLSSSAVNLALQVSRTMGVIWLAPSTCNVAVAGVLSPYKRLHPPCRISLVAHEPRCDMHRVV